MNKEERIDIKNLFMKLLKGIVTLFLIFPTFLWMYTGCTLSSGDVAGTGSQAGNGKVVAVVLNPDGSPAVGVEVYIRPPSFLKDTSEIDLAVLDAVTDSIGSFEIDSVAPGTYFMEINDGGENALFIECVRESTDIAPVNLGSLTLQPSASLMGKVSLENVSDSVSVYVQIYGFEHAQKVDIFGEFLFIGIPAGAFTLRILSSDSTLGIIDGESVNIDPAENYDAGTFRLPFEFWRDTLIVRAILDSNGLDQVPVSDVTEVKDGQIVELNLTNRGIAVIPGIIEELRITHLHLGENLIEYLPHEMGKLHSLVHLGLMRNKLRGIPPSLCSIKKLEHLDLSENQLEIIPRELGGLTSLRNLNLSKNNLSWITKSIGSLTGLTVLDLSSNILEGLPSSIMNLEELDFLSVNFNKLVSVPPDIEQWLDTYSTDKEWKVTQQGEER